MALHFRGKHAEFKASRDPERDLEGGLSTGKTTVALADEIEHLRDEPGIPIYIGRWTDDAVKTLLRPAFEQICRIYGLEWSWDDKQNRYDFPNGSSCKAFGLRTQSQKPEDRYAKIRGLVVSRIYIDQAEQLPKDIAEELRARLRPDLEANVAARNYSRQLTFTPNPPDRQHWLAKQFPENNSIKGRRMWSLSLYDNRHCLPDDFIESQERTYPIEHPKNATMIQGVRGLNIIGDPVYEAIYDRTAHLRRLELNDESALLEAYEVGRHSPVWCVAQRTASGSVELLAGIIGQRMMLEDFLPVVRQYREEWFSQCSFRTATTPMGETLARARRYTLLTTLRENGIHAAYRGNANAPDVRLAMIEYLGGLLRRQQFVVESDPSKWLEASAEGVVPRPFLSFALEGGYTWSEQAVSVGNKTIRKPHDDDWYGNAMRAVETILLNFCAGQPTDDQQASKRRIESTVLLPQGPHSWLCS